MPAKNKKTLDIIPPQITENSGQGIGSRQIKEAGQKKSPLTFLLLLCLIVLLAGVAAYFLIPQKAELIISPSIKRVSFEADKEVSGDFYRTEKAEKEEEKLPENLYFFDKREIETKARGTIRVHNEFNLEQVLIPTTRFDCGGEEEKRFITEERVVIPAGEYLDVEVVALSPGSKLNIGPCKVFTLPGLVGSARYMAVTGESFEPMRGGGIFVERLVVEKSELENIAREYILTQLAQDQIIKENSLTVGYSSPSGDLEERKINLVLEVAADIYTLPDQEKLKRAAAGVDSEQIKKIIVDFPEIDKIRLKLWPFWASRVPEDVARIDIKSDI